MRESVTPLWSEPMLVTVALEGGTRPLFQNFHPAHCKLAALNSTLFEVLFKYKSQLKKVSCSENELNKHRPRIIPPWVHLTLVKMEAGDRRVRHY